MLLGLLMSLPKYWISRAATVNGIDRLYGSPERPSPAQESWLRDRREVYLKSGLEIFRGRWLRVADEWMFTYAPWCRARLPAQETEVQYVGEEWGRRASLALDATVDWEARKFRVSRGKDHKYCVFCRTSISGENPDHHWAHPDFVACETCYQKIVVSRSLEFVPGVSETEDAGLAIGPR
jgi:hypothetical protein